MALYFVSIVGTDLGGNPQATENVMFACTHPPTKEDEKRLKTIATQDLRLTGVKVEFLRQVDLTASMNGIFSEIDKAKESGNAEHYQQGLASLISFREMTQEGDKDWFSANVAEIDAKLGR